MGTWNLLSTYFVVRQNKFCKMILIFFFNFIIFFFFLNGFGERSFHSLAINSLQHRLLAFAICLLLMQRLNVYSQQMWIHILNWITPTRTQRNMLPALILTPFKKKKKTLFPDYFWKQTTEKLCSMKKKHFCPYKLCPGKKNTQCNCSVELKV